MGLCKLVVSSDDAQATVQCSTCGRTVRAFGGWDGPLVTALRALQPGCLHGEKHFCAMNEALAQIECAKRESIGLKTILAPGQRPFGHVAIH